MKKIKIVADSSSDITFELAMKMGVGFVPLNVSFGLENFKDRIEIDVETFFKRLKAEKDLPKTSQPSPDDFKSEFEKYADYDEIICICPTSKCSGTYNSACLAKTLLLDEGFKPNINVVDTLNASLTIFNQVKIAKEMAEAGADAPEILEKLAYVQDKMAIYFVVDTLEYMKKGGRIGNVKATVGALLKIKPLLTFIKGEPVDVAKIRGIDQARAKLVEYFEQNAVTLDEVILVHGDALDQVALLKDELLAKFPQIKINIHEVGAVIGTYTGPGAIGLVFEEKLPRW